MSTPARCRVRDVGVRTNPRAFTLIELLTVMAIIGVLAAIAFGMMGGVKQKSSITRAKSELSVLAQALDAFKLQHGDYPQVGNGSTVGVSGVDPTGMLRALVGLRGAKSSGNEFSPARKSFIDPTKFTYSQDGADPITSTVPLSIIDPWGNPYQYHYVYLQNPTRRFYILFSMGPDGSATAPLSSGKMDEQSEVNSDNIYASK